MIIKTLVENTPFSDDFRSEHGLSLYIETEKNKILFDVGASELFLENAKKLDVDISDVDYLIISHGHYDHGGGLKAFLRVNFKAEVFIHHLAFEKYYALKSNDRIEYIGLDDDLLGHRQIVLTSDRFFIAKGIQLFSNVTHKGAIPASNSGLMKQQCGKMIDDDFVHEQNLLIEEGDKIILVTGCAHNGIVNIVNHFYELRGCMPDYVIGGFHLSSRTGKEERYEDPETISEISNYLLDTKAKYYTGHCTGVGPYEHLKALMGQCIDYIHAGSEIEVNN